MAKMKKKFEMAKKVIEREGGIARISEFEKEGITRPEVSHMCHIGLLSRIRAGCYQLADAEDISDEQKILSLFPGAILCVESAMYYHGYLPSAPQKWSIAVPWDYSRRKLNVSVVAIKPYTVKLETMELGKMKGIFNGFELPVYDKERTVCDCLKNWIHLDKDIFDRAIDCYARDPEKNLDKLVEYAKTLRVYYNLVEVSKRIVLD